MIQALENEMGFLDAPLNKLPQFIRDLGHTYGAEQFINASRAAGIFTVDIETSVPNVLFINEHALDNVQAGSIQGRRTGLEPVLDSDQLA